MNVTPLVIDILIAVIVAGVVVIVVSGVATVGLIAVLVLAGCGISVLIDRRRARRPERLRRRLR